MDVTAALKSDLEGRLDEEGRKKLASLVEAYDSMFRRLNALERMLFGTRSEKIEPVRTEIRRDLTSAEVQAVAQRVAAEAGRETPSDEDLRKATRKVGRAHSEPARKEKRRSRVASLPIVTEVIQLTPDKVPEGMTLDDFEPLGSDESVVRWEYLRAHIVQVRYVMPKMRARNDKSVIVHASAPPTPAPGGKYGASVYAHLIWELRKDWKEAEEILLTIREIYRVEVMTRARSDDPVVLLRARQVEAKPHVEKVLGIVDSMKGEFGDNTAQAKAIGYIANRPDELKRFLDDPNVPLDNNISERALRIVAQGRKSSLFVGPGNCGKSLAKLLTVVRTCELIGVNAYDYLVDVLPRLAKLADRKDSPDDASPEFDCLTPAAWRAAHPAEHRKSRR